MLLNMFRLATTGNALDFGDLALARNGLVAASPTRGVMGGG